MTLKIFHPREIFHWIHHWLRLMRKTFVPPPILLSPYVMVHSTYTCSTRIKDVFVHITLEVRLRGDEMFGFNRRG